jgi:hypothetical protein
MGGQAAFSAIQDAVVSAQTIDGSGQPTLPEMTWKTIGIAIRSEVTSQGGTAIATAQNGTGYVEDSSGLVSAMDSRMANSMFPSHLPGVMLLNLLNATDRTLAIVSDGISGQSVLHIQSVRLASDKTPISETQQDWYVDTATGLPIRVDYAIPASSGQDGAGTIQFVNWQKTSTVLVPQTIQMSQNGGSPSTVLLGVPSFNQGLTSSIFQLP